MGTVPIPTIAVLLWQCCEGIARIDDMHAPSICTPFEQAQFTSALTTARQIAMARLAAHAKSLHTTVERLMELHSLARKMSVGYLALESL